jgi:hypothetical protein
VPLCVAANLHAMPAKLPTLACRTGAVWLPSQALGSAQDLLSNQSAEGWVWGSLLSFTELLVLARMHARFSLVMLGSWQRGWSGQTCAASA